MAISLFGSASNPADSGSAVGPSITLAVVPPASMVAGDLVVLVGLHPVSAGTVVIGATGGQLWTSEPMFAGNGQVVDLFWAVFNGTWAANPSLAFSLAGAVPCSVVMHVFRQSIPGADWTVDNALASGTYPMGNPATIPGATTARQNTVAFALWTQGGAATWGTLVGAGWVVAGSAQYRNLGGTDQVSSYAYRVQTSPQATGSVSKDRAPGGTAGLRSLITFASGLVDMLSVPIETGAPTLDVPAFGQTHVLAAPGLATGAPTFGPVRAGLERSLHLFLRARSQAQLSIRATSRIELSLRAREQANVGLETRP
jgi:hypothetical protein